MAMTFGSKGAIFRIVVSTRHQASGIRNQESGIRRIGVSRGLVIS